MNTDKKGQQCPTREARGDGFTMLEKGFDSPSLTKFLLTVTNYLIIATMTDFLSNNLETFDFGGAKNARHAGFYMTLSANVKSSKSKSYRTSFSEEVRKVVDGKGLKKFRIIVNKFTGELMMVFLNSDNPNVLEFGRESTGQIRIHSRPLIDFMKARLGITGESVSARIELSEDVSNSEEFATFKVIR